MGPWSYGMLGIHLDVTSQTLNERYADYAQIGLMHIARWSIRWGNPQAFVRSGGVVTT
jgi:hypothetical protein